MEYETFGITLSEAVDALQNLGVSLNDYDSEALDVVLAYALAKLKEEQDPYRWPNP